MSAKGLFITGIGTDVGKTVAAAVITKALEADYWKPVQCSDLIIRIALKIARLTGMKTLPETFRLKKLRCRHTCCCRFGKELN